MLDIYDSTMGNSGENSLQLNFKRKFFLKKIGINAKTKILLYSCLTCIFTDVHCVKSVRIWSFSGRYFLRIWAEYGPEKLRIRTLFTLWFPLMTSRNFAAVKHYSLLQKMLLT